NTLYRKYYQAYMDRVLEIWRLWDGIAREKDPQSVYVGNLGGGIDTVKDIKEISQAAAWFNADHQGRAGETPIWNCAQQGRVAQSVMAGRTITNVSGAYSNTQPVWRHVSKAPAELNLLLAQTTASGMVPWFHWLIWPSYIHSAPLLFISEAAGQAVIAVDLSIICKDFTTRYSKGVSFSTSYTKGISTQRICKNTVRFLFQMQLSSAMLSVKP